jgi:phage protein D
VSGEEVGGYGSGGEVVRASISVGPIGMPLSTSVEGRILRVVVDTHLHLPDMFEITLLDEDGDALSTAGLDIGTEVKVSGAKAGDTSPTTLIKGEVTSIEAICAEMTVQTIVRGYDKAHRLQRTRKTRTFLNQTDGDIVGKIARDAGLTTGTVDDPGIAHDHVGQVNQTDWDFLEQRAAELGYETGMADGELYFRKASGSGAGGGLGGLAGAAAGALGLGGGLKFKENLIEFHPRLSAANLTPDVEVRIWDPKQAKVVVGKSDTTSGTAVLSSNTPKALAGKFGGGLLPIPIPPAPPSPGMPDLGPAPSATATVVVDRPAGAGPSTSTAADKLAAGLAEHVGSTFAEAEGLAVGSPDLHPGAKVQISGVPDLFTGTWTISQSRHVFDERQGGYHVRFVVGGRQERSLLGLAGSGPGRSEPSRINGLVCGIVTNNNDPDKRGRVKVVLPWLSPDYESDWARVALPGHGAASGTWFTPETGDEVLVGFEFGDPRRPYVLGGLRNANTKFSLGGEPVMASGEAGSVVRRGIVAPTGTALLFHDELSPAPPMPGGVPTASEVLLGTPDGAIALKIDQVGSTVTLSCAPTGGPGQAPVGTLKIECGQAGTVEIKAGQGGSMTIDGGANLKLTAQASIDIESQGVVSVKGMPIKLN